MILVLVGGLMFAMPVPQTENDVKVTGEATIGGDFILTNKDGKSFNSNSLKGKHVLMYFGFTHCPHICPADVAHISRATELLNTDKIVPVFITVDPERDTPEQLTSYFSSFHKDFIALTGESDTLKKVQADYKIYSKKVEDDEVDGYNMDHSAYTYLMGPDGKYITHFNHNTSGDKMAEEVKKIISD